MAKIKVAKASTENNPFDNSLGFLCLLNAEFGAVPLVGSLILFVILFINFLAGLGGLSAECSVD